jgi:hypothetical protein
VTLALVGGAQVATGLYTERTTFGPPLFLVSLALVLLLRQQVFEWRIRKGSYGTNDEEAREIIAFVVDQSSNIDFTDGGGQRKLFSSADLESMGARLSINTQTQPQH